MNYLAGGVNSPIPIPPGYPKDIISGRGPYVIDKNGKKYIDLWMGYGALIFGHADKDIIKTISETIKNGWFFSYQTDIEKEVAEILHEIIPSAERVRFATTGSDAVAYALRLARAYTGRKKILGIKGGYHGVHENMMPGSGTIFNLTPDLIHFNDPKAVEEKLKSKEYACFILEPILANCGCTPPNDGYLKKIRKICSETGTILIFDEIVNGFRIDVGGSQKFYNITPDLSTFSKAIAGGLPLSVVCGKKEIMENFAPQGGVFFANTFNGSPLSLFVAKTVIRKLKDGNVYKKNMKIGDDFREFLKEQIKRIGISASVQGISSMSTMAFGCKSFEKGILAENYDSKAYNLFIQKMAKKNVLFPPLPTETIFLSPVHESVFEEIKIAIKKSLEELKEEIY
ncbi:MAG: Glutamate-1-semialdehyde 2,1-aminomutase [Berkelbacteria bacterium GW2011_GWA2_38_9]|uniref:Glutamate-1-semialdehyde 2,1-aminomutase n=1 Tax=Berkelbacteria bacterium GW2011_GWA2_38_9 TaxID=1618334 RepID=A0A0G0L9Q8_9BACT|nr:MAG: Glutamate-1-semialdehyde 2,1-aminomutase [Berkelbacteria bacterium GW2011_GWA2_38_9]